MHWLKPPVDDDLTIPIVNPWSRDKHHVLGRYIDAFTTAMKGKNWSGLHYIDLFAGAGIGRIETTGELEWGSPLIAALAPHPFTRLHLCEKDPKCHAALKRRLETLSPAVQFQLLRGDANKLAQKVLGAVPSGALSLAFLDPFGLHLHYATLKRLSGIRADLILFFPHRMDAIRNWKAYYLENPESNLDLVLGPDSGWRAGMDGIPPERYGETLRSLYVCQIGKLGFEHFDWEPIPSAGNAMYYLIFCSKDKAGAKIWRNVSAKKPDGQRTFLPRE